MKKLVLVIFLLLITNKVFAKDNFLSINNLNQKFYNQCSNNKVESSDIYKNLGISIAEEGDYQKAVEHFNIAIMLNSNNDSAYYNLAICYMKMKNLDLAIKNLKKCNNISPNYKALINLGALYSDKAMYDQSMKYLELAKVLNEKDIILFHNLGLIYGLKGDYQKAIDNFKKVTELDPDNKNAYYNLGLAYHQIGNNELAIENLNKANDN